MNKLNTRFSAPDFGDLITVADGVHWTRMKIPGKLDHINVYLIEDTEGWFIVDTGPQSTEN